MDIEAHSQEPIINTVEVVNGAQFRDAVLSRRVQPLLTATTLYELYERLDPVAHSLSVLGDVRYRLDTVESSTNVVPRAVKTQVILSNTQPVSPTVFQFVSNNDIAGLSGQQIFHNRLGFGEQVELAGRVYSNPAALGSGSVTTSVPMPLGASKLAVQGFFFNQDRPWGGYALASHGLSAKITSNLSKSLTADLGIEAVSRHVHSMGDAASDTVRAAAGANSVKVSALAGLQHIGSNYKLNAVTEFAGKPGDSAYTKIFGSFNVFEKLCKSGALVADFGVSAGFMKGEARIFDNFVLGGVKDVYGVALNSMGPKDGQDFIGGQAFYQGRGTLTAKVPGKPFSPLRLTALLSTGSLQSNCGKTFQDNLNNLAKSSPVVSAAVGLTYNTDAATCEMLYVVPLKTNHGDVTREGFHLGVQLTFA